MVLLKVDSLSEASGYAAIKVEYMTRMSKNTHSLSCLFRSDAARGRQFDLLLSRNMFQRRRISQAHIIAF